METARIVIPNAIMLGEVSRLIAEGHSVVIMTKGCSMLPFIRGEKDSVELVGKSFPSVGDIALAQIARGHYVLHRIIGIDGEKVTLKGDGNLDGTEKCLISDICGVVSFIIRPDESRIDCGKASFGRLSRFWRRLPRFIRRVFLGIYRRIVL